MRLNAELESCRERISQLQDELTGIVAAYEAKVAELESDTAAKAQWAQQLNKELEEKAQELATCVQYLDQAEKTVEERTLWARRLEAEAEALQAKLSLIQSSTWVKVGRKLRLSPGMPAN
jgi:hypothetical protein